MRPRPFSHAQTIQTRYYSRHVSTGSNLSDPFASDPEAKRKGMAAFQPDALTLSRGDLWRNRRAFAEHVLATGKPLHPLAPAFVRAVDDAATAIARREAFDFTDLNLAFQRITRRVVFGDEATDDVRITDLLGDLMAAANKTPGKPAAPCRIAWAVRHASKVASGRTWPLR